MGKPSPKSGSILWDGLNRGAAWLYALIIRSRIGRVMTGYRKADAALAKGRHRCSPMSPARLRLVESVESGRLVVGIRAVFSALFGCPIAFYGLFGLFYGLFGVLLFYLAPRVVPTLNISFNAMLLSAVIAILSVPLILTKASLADALGHSRIARLILVRLLGVPQDRLTAPPRRFPRMLFYLAFLPAAAAAVGSLFLHPLVIPIGLVSIGVCGLIFTYPEAGVVLSTVMLPMVWFRQGSIFVLVLIILLTWCSYGIKLLFLHRTIRFGFLDRVVLLWGFVLLTSGFTGVVVNRQTVLQSILLFICLSDYFLIVNLMTTRAYIRRCLIGVGISVVMVTALAYLRHVPVDSLGWLAGSRAGNAIVEAFRASMDRLSGLWVDHSEIYLVLVFPWLYAYLLHTKRFYRKVLGLICIGLDLGLIIMTRSVSALICVVAVTGLFFLLLGHKWLSAGLVALPVMGCGAVWIAYLYPISDALQTILSRSRHYKALLRDSLWRMVWEHPAGIGVGEEAFVAVYPAYAAPDLGAVTDSGNLGFEILLNYGWPGLIIMAVVLFLFLQKGLTCLGHTTSTKDRAMILGGIASIVGVLIFGVVRSFITSPRIFFTILLAIALCSAYENILFDESDVLTAEVGGTTRREDRIYRH